MASYTDSPSALGQFNPYVQQLPVEAMREVGMYKQQQYNEGIQKIQSNIENVAGLDVIRNVDKKYLQSKLNELGSNLRTVAAGDFSDFQLVNSTSGMVNQVAKDRNIVNAVSNSSRYRKEVANMEESIKKGESSPSNEYIFNKDASAWLNSDDINSSMNARYNKYTNWKKNAIDVIKSLTKSENVSDNAFTTDARGNLVIADAMVRTKLAGISPEQIQQALNVGLTPSDFKQMEIDGRYSYASATPEALIGTVTQSFNNDIKNFTDKREVLSNALASTTSIAEKEKLQQQINSVDQYVSQMRSEYENTTNQIASGDLEAAKAKLYTTRQMNGFANAFSHTETSKTYEASPLADMAMRREVKNQDWKKFTMQYSQDERFHQDKMAMDMLDLETKKEANLLKKKELEGYGGLPQPIAQEDLPKYNLAKVVADVEKTSNDIKTADAQFMQQNGKDLKWLDQQKQAWMQRPGSVDPMVAQHFNKTEPARRKMESDQAMIMDINKQAIAKHGDIYKHIPSDMKGLYVNRPEGRIALTPKDFVDFNQNLDKYKTLKVTAGGGMAGTGGTSTVTYDDARAKRELSPKEYYLFSLYKKQNTVGNRGLSEGERHILERAQEFKKSVNEPYRKTLKRINDFTADEVTKRLTVQQGVAYGVPTASASQKSSIGTVLTNFADLADKQGGGLAGSPGFDSALARKIALDGNARYNITVVEGTSLSPAMYEMTATGSKGEVVKMKMTPEQKISVFGNMFEASPLAQAARPYQEQIRKMGGYSTAPSKGTTSVSNSYLSKIDFPNTTIYGVSGNIESPDGGKSYSVRLNIYDPVKGVWHENIPYPASGLVNEEQLTKAMQGLSDSSIYEMLTGSTASSKALNQVKNASKKPL